MTREPDLGTIYLSQIGQLEAECERLRNENHELKDKLNGQSKQASSGENQARLFRWSNHRGMD